MKRAVFVLFIALHLLLLNINAAEWGDSYRILRAAEFLRDGRSYPAGEKRPPLYSALLAMRPIQVDPVVWGRLFMFAVSIAAFLVFVVLLDQISSNSRVKSLALVLFALNPVYLYWSVRVYADVFFSLLVLLIFCVFGETWSMRHKTWSYAKPLFLAVLTILCIMTRFEGYFVFLTVLVPLSLGVAKKKVGFLRDLVSYLTPLLALYVPYVLYRNPFTSKYLDEPAGRVYDIKMLVTYMASLLFLFGFVHAAFFVIQRFRGVRSYFSKNVGIAVFVFLELALILVWPAAVPRLFVPIIPLLLIPLSESIVAYFSESSKPKTLWLLVLPLGYLLVQLYLRLQFLVNIKYALIAVFVCQLVIIGLIYFKKYTLFLWVLGCSLLIWSLSVIWTHKDLYISIKEASVYAAENLTGVVGYNDVSSVSDWYLNGNSNRATGIKGVYFNYSKKGDLDEENIRAKGFNYILMTNEHNTDTILDIEKRPYLQQVKEFSFYINGKTFWTKVIKVL